MNEQHKVSLVTGSGKHRIGWHVVEALAARGHRLAIHYRTSVAEAELTVSSLRQQGLDAAAFQADLADEHAVAGMIEKVLARFGRLDVLVNCAAIWERKRLEDIKADDVRRHFEVNTLGTFVCSQLAGLRMVKQPEGGCIVTLGDWATVRPYVDFAAYFPSKGAIPALTRTLAVELGLRNPRVRVNCIMPGPVMLQPDLPEAERRQAIDATLVKREGTGQDIARAVLFLIDNDFVNGVCLPVDGGRTVFAQDATCG